MPLPIAHGMVGICVMAAFAPERRPGRAWPLWAAGGLLGVLPDVDHLLTIWRWMGRDWHHGFAHSLLFAAAAGGVGALFARRRRLRVWFGFGLAGASHPLLDYLFTESRGVDLFWPFSATHHRLGLMPPIGYDWRRDSLAEQASDLLTICAFELAMGAALLMLVLLLRAAAVNRPDR